MRNNPQTFRGGGAFLAAIGCLIVLAGCGAGVFSYVGTTARPENRLELVPDTESRGTWQTPDLVVNYIFKPTQQTLALEATVNLAGHMQRGFSFASNVFLGVHFLDSENRVLSSRSFALSGNRTPIRQWRIERQLEIPAGADAVAFSYSGRVGEGGLASNDNGPGGVSWSFWQRP
ncbi:MAG: hypothetical protein LJE63_01070 [Desulfobacteraceae bacterium]|jgi:hypothetical protein|nr:hypothetical protein [Desulfobacteraceae bacterium]